MEMLSLLYPITAFVFIRLMVYCFAQWAVAGRSASGRLICLLAGIVCAAFAVDSSVELFRLALLAPYRWLLPLVLFAVAYVVFRVSRKAYLGFADSAVPNNH